MLYELTYDPLTGDVSSRSVHVTGRDMEMQDCRMYDFGNGPRVLLVENNEAFPILDPDDGL